jgi:hypothetical protein
MTTYPLQQPTHGGSAVALSAPGGTAGDLAPTGVGVALVVSAGTAVGTATITLPVVQTWDGLGVTSRSVNVLGGQLKWIPLPSSVYGVGTTAVNYSSVSGLTVAVVRVP